MKINIKALALSIGIFWGLAVFLLTQWIVIMDWGFLSEVDGAFLGYSLSWIGAFVGIIYGFVVGYVSGALIGFLYNKFAK